MRVGKIVVAALSLVPACAAAAVGFTLERADRPTAIMVAEDSPSRPARDVGKSADHFGRSVENTAKDVGHTVERGAKQVGRSVVSGWESLKRAFNGGR